MLNALLTRWRRPTEARQDLGESTLPSAPMPLAQPRSGDSLLQSLLRWLPGEPDPWGGLSKSNLKPSLLPQLRSEFMACLRGLQDTDELERSIGRARCLRDFWHLRGSVYTEVARHYSQAEAESRLAALAPFFHDYQATLPPGAKRH